MVSLGLLSSWIQCVGLLCGCGVVLALAGKSNLNLSQWMIVSILLRGPSDEPLQDGIEIGLFFRADAVTRHFPVGYALQVQGVYQFVYCEMAAQIGFVAEDQKWDAFHGRLLQEDVELFLCYWQGLFVGRIDDEPG